MHVAIAIVGFRNAGDILTCLGALATATYPHFEVVICENGGEESYQSLVKALPAKLPGGQPTRIICAADNLGYAAGVNVCLRATVDADAWWILNPDTVPDSRALEFLVQRLRVGDCEVVGGVLYGCDHRVQTLGGRWLPWLARAEAIGKGVPVDESGIEDVERLIDFVSGASMLVSRRFVDTVGPMREDYFLYCEEVEWCVRARSVGMRLGFADRARVMHNQGSSTGSGLRVSERPKLQIYLDERNKLLLTADRFPKRMAIAAIAALFLILLRYGMQGTAQQVGIALRGWWAGLKGERGRPNWREGVHVAHSIQLRT